MDQVFIGNSITTVTFECCVSDYPTDLQNIIILCLFFVIGNHCFSHVKKPAHEEKKVSITIVSVTRNKTYTYFGANVETHLQHILYIGAMSDIFHKPL